MNTLAKLSSASSGRVPEVPAALANRDSKTGGGGIDGTMPAYNGQGPPYEVFGLSFSPGVGDVKVHRT